MQTAPALHTVLRQGGGQSPRMLLLSGQSAASIDFSPLTKIHQTAELVHRFDFSIDGPPPPRVTQQPPGYNHRAVRAYIP